MPTPPEQWIGGHHLFMGMHLHALPPHLEIHRHAAWRLLGDILAALGGGYARSCKQTSENTPSETVWKIGQGPEIEVPKAVKWGRRGPLVRFLPSKWHDRGTFCYFPNSF